MHDRKRGEILNAFILKIVLILKKNILRVNSIKYFISSLVRKLKAYNFGYPFDILFFSIKF